MQRCDKITFYTRGFCADKVILIDSEKIKFSRFAYELNLLVAE